MFDDLQLVCWCNQLALLMITFLLCMTHRCRMR